MNVDTGVSFHFGATAMAPWTKNLMKLPQGWLRRPSALAGVVLIGLLCLISVILALDWPFREAEFIQSLEHFSSCEVRAENFHKLFFPHPGYRTEGVTFARRSQGRTVVLASVRTIEAVGSWAALVTFTHTLTRLKLAGLTVSIPSSVPPPMSFYPEMREETTVSELNANGATLKVAPQAGGGQTLRFDFSKLMLKEVSKDKAISLDTSVHLSTLSADVSVVAKVGPFSKGQINNTPLTGSYRLANANLGESNAVGGLLSARGAFSGILDRCEIHGDAHIESFLIKQVRHPVKLDGTFDTTANTLKGDVSLRRLTVTFLNSELQAAGRVQSEPGEKGKTESMTIVSTHARIEDLLQLFVRSNPPMLTGPMKMEASLKLPPGPGDFLRKLRLNGGFTISSAKFRKPETQGNVVELSKRARSEKTSTHSGEESKIASDLEASVRLQSGTAYLSHARFSTRGATVAGGGTYNLITDAIDLRGKLAMQASLSKAAGGVKSVFLFPLNPLFRDAKGETVLPIHVTGIYPHPFFHLSLRDKH